MSTLICVGLLWLCVCSLVSDYLPRLDEAVKKAVRKAQHVPSQYPVTGIPTLMALARPCQFVMPILVFLIKLRILAKTMRAGKNSLLI